MGPVAAAAERAGLPRLARWLDAGDAGELLALVEAHAVLVARGYRGSVPERAAAAAIRTGKGVPDALAGALAAVRDAQGIEARLREAPRAAEAFSGAGLYSLALACEGWDLVEACELDARAVETARQVHDRIEVCDARTWEPPPGLDLLTGGPPCQPWSQGGRLLGPEDERNFYPRLVGWLARARPRVFAFENSARITTIPRFRAYFDEWWRAVREAGYVGTTWVLNAADYGTPQARLRAWVVGWRAGASEGLRLREAPPVTHAIPSDPRVAAGELLPWVRAFDRLASGCCGGYGLHSCRWAGNAWGQCETCTGAQGAWPANYAPATLLDEDELSENARAYLLRAKQGRARVWSYPPTPASPADAWREDEPERVSDYLSPAMVRNLMRGLPHGLVTTEASPSAYDLDRDDPSAVRAYVETLRRMSVRSAATLMDVPAWYDFAGGRRAAYSQVGNGVPVCMGRAVARHLLAALGYEVPLAGSAAAVGRRGFWPMTHLDPCATFPGIQGYAGEYAPESAPEVAGDPRARPHADAGAWADDRARSAPSAAGAAAWDADTGAYAPPTGWRPSSADDVPPGFPDRAYFLGWLDGEDEETIARFEALYAPFGGVFDEGDDGDDGDEGDEGEGEGAPPLFVQTYPGSHFGYLDADIPVIAVAYLDGEEVGSLFLNTLRREELDAPCLAALERLEARGGRRLPALRVSEVELREDARGRGFGVELYAGAIEAAGARGSAVVADTCMLASDYTAGAPGQTSGDARRVWASGRLGERAVVDGLVAVARSILR